MPGRKPEEKVFEQLGWEEQIWIQGQGGCWFWLRVTHLVSHQEATDQCISSVTDSYYLFHWVNKEDKIKTIQTAVKNTAKQHMGACNRPALLN